MQKMCLMAALLLVASIAFSQAKPTPGWIGSPRPIQETPEGIFITTRSLLVKVTQEGKMSLIADGITFDVSSVALVNDASLGVNSSKIKRESFTQNGQAMNREIYSGDFQTVMQIVRRSKTVIHVNCNELTVERPKAEGEE